MFVGLVFSFRFRALAMMNCAAAIPSQTTAATNNSGMNRNEAQSISVPANSHQGHSETSWLKPRQVPCQSLTVETSPATGMARHSRMLVTRKINLMTRKIRATVSKFTREQAN
jgi:hypothetical protein